MHRKKILSITIILALVFPFFSVPAKKTEAATTEENLLFSNDVANTSKDLVSILHLEDSLVKEKYFKGFSNVLLGVNAIDAMYMMTYGDFDEGMEKAKGITTDVAWGLTPFGNLYTAANLSVTAMDKYLGFFVDNIVENEFNQYYQARYEDLRGKELQKTSQDLVAWAQKGGQAQFDTIINEKVALHESYKRHYFEAMKDERLKAVGTKFYEGISGLGFLNSPEYEKAVDYTQYSMDDVFKRMYAEFEQKAILKGMNEFLTAKNKEMARVMQSPLTISGKVVTKDDKPIANATVTIEQEYNQYLNPVTSEPTNTYGEFNLFVPHIQNLDQYFKNNKIYKITIQPKEKGAAPIYKEVTLKDLLNKSTWLGTDQKILKLDTIKETKTPGTFQLNVTGKTEATTIENSTAVQADENTAVAQMPDIFSIFVNVKDVNRTYTMIIPAEAAKLDATGSMTYDVDVTPTAMTTGGQSGMIYNWDLYSQFKISKSERDWANEIIYNSMSDKERAQLNINDYANAIAQTVTNNAKTAETNMLAFNDKVTAFIPSITLQEVPNSWAKIESLFIDDTIISDAEANLSTLRTDTNQYEQNVKAVLSAESNYNQLKDEYTTIVE